MRVWPFFTVSANIVRSMAAFWKNCGLNTWLHAVCRSDQDVARIARVDHDRVDASSEERISGVHARVGRIVDALVGELGPRLAGVGGLVDAYACLAPRRAAIAFAGAEIDRARR